MDVPKIFQHDTRPIQIGYTVVLAIAVYNCVELVVLIFMTFKRYTGLYFWSLLLATMGVATEAIFLLLFFYREVPDVIAFTFASIGWCFMITGQALVLYSRLHMVLHSQLGLRLVLTMIITCAIIFHIPDIVTGYGTVIPNRARPTFLKAFHVMEKIQLTGFTVQQFILSGLYLCLATRLLMFVSVKDRRKELYHLIAMNITIIFFDTALVVFVYLNWWVAHESLKPFVYSIKLKLEFAVLRTLVSMSKPTERELPDFVDPDQVQGDLTHAQSMPMGELRHSETGSIGSENLGWDQTTTARTSTSDFEQRNGTALQEERRPLRPNSSNDHRKRTMTYP